MMDDNEKKAAIKGDKGYGEAGDQRKEIITM